MITANVVVLGATAQVAAAANDVAFVPQVFDKAQEYFIILASLAGLKLFSLFKGGTK